MAGAAPAAPLSGKWNGAAMSQARSREARPFSGGRAKGEGACVDELGYIYFRMDAKKWIHSRRNQRGKKRAAGARSEMARSERE